MDNHYQDLETDHLTPAEIDARHARHLLERALEQIERGEQGAAMLSCKQALHLAPHSSLAHSVAGLLALLKGDLKAAIEGYQQAVGDSEDLTERQRLALLQDVQAQQQSTHAAVNIAAILPNVQAEILRLRQAIHAAPPASFLHDQSTLYVPPAPADVYAADGAAQPHESLAAPSVGRQRSSILTFVTIAIIAALLSFFLVRALRSSVSSISPAPEPAVPTSSR